MLLETVAQRTRCAFVSPFANLNIVLGINIAGYLASKGLRVLLSMDFSVPLDLAGVIEELYGSEAVERVAMAMAGESDVKGLDAYVYVSERDGASIRWRGRVYAMVPKLGRLPRNVRETIYVYRVRRIGGNTYSFLSKDGIVLVRVERFRLVEQGVPEEVLALHRELVELCAEFGAVKAFTVVNMLRKRYGYSREQAIELVRKAIAMGLIKYENGYLMPYT